MADDHTLVNLKRDVEDMAVKHGLSPNLESRFARRALGLEQSGLSYFRIAPDFEQPFGHTHSEQEEVYVIVSGNARAKVSDQVIDLAEWDALRVPPGVWRSLAGGPDGCEVLVFGAPNTENKDTEMEPGFWGQ
jgi:mannose-6-phosphate isomerase-like protein (cupin superfamily)